MPYAGKLEGDCETTLGHPWGNAVGAAANRVAVAACVEHVTWVLSLRKKVGHPY